MRILYVTDTYFPHINGVYYAIQHLALKLQSKSYETAILAPSDTSHFTKSKIDNINVYGMPSLSIGYYGSVRIPISFHLKRRIKEILSSFKPDVIHIQGFFILNKTILEVNKEFNIPVIGTNHFMAENLTVFFPTQMLKGWLEKWIWKKFTKVFNQAKLVTSPTETGAKMIRCRLNVPVIPVSNGINLKRFSEKHNLPDIRAKYNLPNKPILLSIGRLDPEKHTEEVLEAAAIALKRSNFCLVICGKGTDKELLEDSAKKLGIENDVIFTGFVPDEELPEFYKISKCFITASIAELQSLATMEAMASGLPVIAANAGALAELVHNEENGYLFEPGEIEVIAGSISSIFDDKMIQKDMGEKSLKNISEHDEDETVKVYEGLYENLLMQP